MENQEFLLQLLRDWMVPSVIGAFAAFLLGVIWYHPKILGERWLGARGKTVLDIRAASSPFIVTYPLWLLTALFFVFMVMFFHIDSAAEIFLLACLLWVAFAMPPLLMARLYTGYPFEAVAIDASYQLAGYYAIAITYVMLKTIGIV